jgi:hypothetical protein
MPNIKKQIKLTYNFHSIFQDLSLYSFCW